MLERSAGGGAVTTSCLIYEGPSIWAGFPLFFFLSLFLLFAGAAGATSLGPPVTSVGQIYIDDEGHRLGHPIGVAYDPVEDEIYVINDSTNRIVVYGPDFFPRISIGVGRGIGGPRGMVIRKDGEVYICQVVNANREVAGLTVLNGAFFVDREISYENIPEIDYIPQQLAVNAEGNIYLTGYETNRGVTVLDKDGNFLRKLQPEDELSAEALSKLNEDLPEEGEVLAAEEAEPADEENPFADLPDEFRPRRLNRNQASGFQEGSGPVLINFVTIDNSGRLYLVSAELGKIYVYSPDEEFLFSFGQKGGSPRQLSQPRSLAVDDKRELIYVVDYMRHTILAYNMTGEFLFEIGGRGFGPGWFNFPFGIALNKQGQLIVGDLFNRRVQILEMSDDDILPFRERVKVAPGTDFEDEFPEEESFNQEESIDKSQDDAVNATEVAVPVEFDSPTVGTEEMSPEEADLSVNPGEEGEVQSAGGQGVEEQATEVQATEEQEIPPPTIEKLEERIIEEQIIEEKPPAQPDAR